MKLTWFGGTAMRIHIAGRMLVADPEEAGAGVDPTELVSGADQSFNLSDRSLAEADPRRWRPRQVPRAIDEAVAEAVVLYRLGDDAVLVDAIGEPPLVLLRGGEAPELGRWSGDAVVVIFEGGAVSAAAALLVNAQPRLMALALDEVAVDEAIAEVREHLGTTALVALEPGLAVEV